ncbi:unnamed protein product [Mytilus edulis]|uniref:Uncharacterized protein n=1 Tax=Mytilus edulis TaxID=6550 RepID=A0A8S3Q5C0_MYTED|nr:unnamed protein product [Mytilus edulis]
MKIKHKEENWLCIAEELQSHGYKFTLEQVKGIQKTLITALKRTRNRNNRSGSDKKACAFQQELKEMLGGNPSIEQTTTSDAIPDLEVPSIVEGIPPKFSSIVTNMSGDLEKWMSTGRFMQEHLDWWKEYLETFTEEKNDLMCVFQPISKSLKFQRSRHQLLNPMSQMSLTNILKNDRRNQ